MKKSCPNIGGREVSIRRYLSYISLMAAFIGYVYIFQFQPNELRFLIFIPFIGFAIPYLEAKDKTCIVLATGGYKNMGHKYEKEKNIQNLKNQRKKSFSLILKSSLFSLMFTFISYLL